MNNFDFKNFLTENKLTKTSVLREGLGAYEFEKGKKEGEAEEKKTMSKKALKQKIKEMILAEMELDVNDNEVDAKLDDFLDEAKKKKKDEEEAPEEELDLDLGEETPEGEEDLNLDFDATEEVPAEDNFNIDTSAVDPNIKAVQDALTQAQAAAEKIQDEKLTQQIGNTITMFTRTHIANKEPIR
jgi:predicted O-linked N-acetylglucosamine transferase (SPINDLY family)